MRSKYQIKSQQSVTSFDKKDDFLKKCSFELNETLHKRNRQSDIHYSYDYGKTWNHILNLKNDRQSIQNEKKPQNENRNNSKKGESTLEQSSGDSNWFTYLIVIALIIGGVYYFTNKNNQNKVPRTEYNQETITPMDSSIDDNLDEPILNQENSQTESNENSYNEDNTESLDNNYQTESNENSYNEDNTESSNNNSQTVSNNNSSSNTYQKPQRQQQPEKVKCNGCNGTGKCPKCGKSQQDGYYSAGRYIRINEIRMGMVICTHCHGYGIFMEETGTECGSCKGQGWEFCRVCNYNGRGNNIGQCQSCKGTGYRN